jgi:hypothetical protein
MVPGSPFGNTRQTLSQEAGRSRTEARPLRHQYNQQIKFSRIQEKFSDQPPAT